MPARPAVRRRSPVRSRPTAPLVQPLEARRLLSGAAPADALTPAAASTRSPAAASALTISYTGNTVPSTAVTGRKTTGSVAVAVTNSGAAAASGTDTVTLYATTSGAIDADSTQVATVARRLSLRTTQTATVHVAVRTLPATPGSYTLLARVSDPSGATADATTGPSVTVGAATVTLAAAVDFPLPRVVRAGQPIAFAVVLANTGNVASTGTATFTLGLSTNGTVLDYTLATVHRSVSVRPDGKRAVVRFQVRVPPTAKAASYVPVVTVTQGTATATAAGTDAVVVTAKA